ncbi:putative Signal transduction response regulator, receiver and diguanylate cyclase domain [Nitrospira sp. KM1]|uniref:two-component system response regulator n=1 Tax=Nitrospira sp. KM1 TaxID=1936990 RepID=UPI0013A77AF1|nr:GGDEF domain-containing response regulator [Nitrospira sp. KM1]BCA55509.1 putative Signal transduction response regulator, receiver and diguanylate cyclase domain [Nitrospira sp. KM1]
MITVLLIEDNDVDARLTQDLLAEWSVEEFEITHVKTLTEGLNRLGRSRFDAILLDLSLPDAFGLPTVRQVHATNSSIPLVVLSGVSDQTLALQAVQQGAQDYLVKGQGHPELLARAVRYAIERKRTEERLTYLAQYDHLTGLVNRSLFRDRLVQAMARSKRIQQPIGLMLLDLDRFKAVNDTLGHDIGDELLKTVSERLKSCVREVDTVARMGGDEFTIILEGVATEAAIVIVAKRIVEALSAGFDLKGHTVTVGVSIGITVFPHDDQGVDELLKHADAAMYRAKQQGGSGFSFHEASGYAASAAVSTS